MLCVLYTHLLSTTAYLTIILSYSFHSSASRFYLFQYSTGLLFLPRPPPHPPQPLSHSSKSPHVYLPQDLAVLFTNPVTAHRYQITQFLRSTNFYNAYLLEFLNLSPSDPRIPAASGNPSITTGSYFPAHRIFEPFEHRYFSLSLPPSLSPSVSLPATDTALAALFAHLNRYSQVSDQHEIGDIEPHLGELTRVSWSCLSISLEQNADPVHHLLGNYSSHG